MAAALGLPPSKIRLSLGPDLQEVYRVRAWNRSRRLVFEQGFTPRWTRMPYLPGRPHQGSVHPACGGVRLSQKGRVIRDESIPTDREFFWRIFQERWLPAIEDFMAARLVSGEAPAVFWEDMRIEVAIDETDRRLGLGEERVAPMEALHEDLYFVLLDFFRIFSQEKGLAAAQFGRIFPKVLPVARKGIPSARLYARPVPPQPPVEAGAARRRVSVHSFRLAAGGIELGLTANGGRADPAEIDLLCRIARSWGHHLQSGSDGKTFHLKYRPPRALLPRARQPSRTCTGAPPLHRLIPLNEVEAWVRRLGELPHLNAWRAGVTCQGRAVWALEAVLAGAGRPSVARMRLLKPTLLLNARHHANEVSGTNAALRLMWELGGTGWGRRVLKRLNVAAVPLENADGVATLEALLPEAGDHKLHAARYNALGVEWYADYFAAEPRFPEARVKAGLWRRWLPRVVLDAHGVPSHEWDQPFSGYAPHRFRQYWIPRSLIYVIVPFIDQPEHGGYPAARSIVEAMARAIGPDRALRRLGAEFEDRYRRYARAWEPDIFPPAHDRGLVAVPPEKRIAGLNFAEQRFPVTVSEIVTEVTDEVVSGRLLEHCARAHMAAAKALMQWLLGQASAGKLRRRPLPGGGLRLAWEPDLGAR
jgi:hypothetical protein